MSLSVVILALVTLQRVGELWLSNRNTRRLLALGAHEVGRGHYPLIVAVHALWLAALWGLAPGRPVQIFWLGLYVALQLARIWVLATLGSRWTTRIIILPDAPLVRTGPYRFVDHPNYVVVAGEIAVLPLVFGLPLLALIFSALNAAVLTVRIREENRALGRLRA
ncbi:MAG TPA: isoprenylcysteine carboxylmethyltransferase family protein [Sphingomicrobium sp.]